MEVYRSKTLSEKVNSHKREQKDTTANKFKIGAKFKVIKGSFERNWDYSNTIEDFVSSKMTEEKDYDRHEEHEEIHSCEFTPLINCCT